jgi:hypothetical protein
VDGQTDPTPTDIIGMCAADGARHAAGLRAAMLDGDLPQALEQAVALRLDGTQAEDELRRLTGSAVPPTPVLSTAEARQLARHVKAALKHLRAAERIAEDAGVDLATEPYGNHASRVLVAAAAAVEDADLWALRTADANGCDTGTWAGARWCDQPDGALPQV